MKIFLIILFLLTSIVACSKPDTYCWGCTTTYTQTMWYRQYDDNPKPAVFVSLSTFNVCDISEDNILIIEQQASDSTQWYSGYIDNKVSRVTRCQKR